jgi:DNA-binding MarR family transcriptional regulator
MTPLERAVYDVIARHPGWHAPRIAEGLGRSMSGIEATLRRMREKGYIRSEKKLRPVLRSVRCYEVRNGGRHGTD